MMTAARVTTTPTSVETTATAVDIPQEIADLIVDVLSHDFTSLKLCSLISQQWRPRSQYHLHRRVKLDRKINLPLLASVYNDPLLASYVHIVDIESLWDPFWAGVPPVLEKLDSVHDLTLSCAGDINSSMRRSIVHQFSRLESLTLACVSFDDFAALSGFLNALPNLTSLDIKNVYWTRSEKTLSLASVHRFRKLRIAYCTEQHMFVKWLMGAGEKLKLELLTLTWYAEADSVREFIHFLGEDLRHLSFSYVFSDASRDWKDHPLDLSFNTNLRTLEFMTNVMLPHSWGSLPTIPEMLNSVTSSLDTLSVHLANLDEEPVPSDCLSLIDRIIDQPRFRSLSDVFLYTDMSVSESRRQEFLETLRSSIHTAMPRMSAKGVLHVELPG